MDDLERRRVEALEGLAERTGDLSGVTADLLHEIRRDAVSEASEVATTMTAEAKIQQRSSLQRWFLRGLAGVMAWVWLAVGVVDWHAHLHEGIYQVPLAPALPGALPVGVIFTTATFVIVAALLLTAHRMGNGKGT